MQVTGVLSIQLGNLLHIVKIERDQSLRNGKLGDIVTIKLDTEEYKLEVGDSVNLQNINVHLKGNAFEDRRPNGWVEVLKKKLMMRLP